MNPSPNYCTAYWGQQIVGTVTIKPINKHQGLAPEVLLFNKTKILKQEIYMNQAVSLFTDYSDV